MMSSSPPPPSLPSGGGSFFRGYTKLCKGLTVILLLVHLLVQLFPSAVTYLALIPSRTIPFAWNLITAGYVEQTIPGVIISIIGLLLFGKLLEPLWGAKELSKFVFIVNFSTSVCVFITAIALYYITQQESYLYTPLSGFYGVLSGLLVGMKQLLPDHELNLFVLKIKGKWVPSLVALISVVVSFFVKELVSCLPIILFGIYMSWIYLRYFQKRLETGLKGDPSEEFSFSSFFPEVLRPILDPIASIFHRLLCGRSDRADARGQTLDTSPLPGSDSIEANRRSPREDRSHLPGAASSPPSSGPPPACASSGRRWLVLVIACSSRLLRTRSGSPSPGAIIITGLGPPGSGLLHARSGLLHAGSRRLWPVSVGVATLFPAGSCSSAGFFFDDEMPSFCRGSSSPPDPASPRRIPPPGSSSPPDAARRRLPLALSTPGCSAAATLGSPPPSGIPATGSVAARGELRRRPLRLDRRPPTPFHSPPGPPRSDLHRSGPGGPPASSSTVRPLLLSAALADSSHRLLGCSCWLP